MKKLIIEVDNCQDCPNSYVDAPGCPFKERRMPMEYGKFLNSYDFKNTVHVDCPLSDQTIIYLIPEDKRALRILMNSGEMEIANIDELNKEMIKQGFVGEKVAISQRSRVKNAIKTIQEMLNE